MKLTLLLLCVNTFLAVGNSYSQHTKFTLKGKDVQIEDVLKEIKEKSEFRFFYNHNLVDVKKRVNYDVENATVSELLNQVLNDAGIQYEIVDKTIILSPKPTSHENPVEQPQKKTITGKVTDEKGLPLPGVSIVVKGTTVGIITDFDGNYTLEIPEDAEILVFSFVGMLPKEMIVGNQSKIDVIMEENTIGLEEVVAIGYGMQKKVTLTGSISSVNTETLVKSPSASVANTLAGRVTGLATVQYSGMPGADDPRIYVRGIGSLSASNSSPLIMVDGVERSFSQLDPNEIESITVLKDASATAVYGIRGANGVILVTTKRGAAGPPKISVSLSAGFQTPTRLIEYADAYTYATTYNQAQLRDNPDAVLKFSDEAISAFKNHSDPIIYPDMDWPSYIFKPASFQTTENINISGGTENVKYFVSFGYLQQDGMFKTFGLNYDYNFGYERYNYRANLDIDITKTTKISLTAGGRAEIREEPYQPGGMGWTTDALFEYMNWATPFTGPGIIDGKYVRSGNTYISGAKYDALDHFYNMGTTRMTRNILNLDIALEQNLEFITKGLSFKVKYANNSNYNQTKSRRTSRAYYEPYFEKDLDPTRPESREIIYKKYGSDGILDYSEAYSKARDWYFESSFFYNRGFGDHNLTGLLLYNAKKIFYPGVYTDIPLGYVGIVGRITYDYMTKYMMDLNVGYNGSENFAPGKRFGFFPAVSLGWILTEENFMKNLSFVDYFKLRASYGIVGNDRQGSNRFLYLPDSYSANSGGYNFGIDNPGNRITASEGKVGNPYVSWEKAKKKNIGFDLKVIEGKLGVSVDLFDEYRDNILATRQTVPQFVAINLPALNIGEVENKGYELELSWNDKIKNFGYSVNLNMSYSHNKVLFKDEIPKRYNWLQETGQSVGQRFGLIFDGFWTAEDMAHLSDFPDHTIMPSPGDMRYKDLNDDGKIDNYDRAPIGYPEYPAYVFGANIGLSYKNFDLTMLISGATHTSRNLSDLYRTAFGDTKDKALLQYMVDEQWTPEKGNTAGYPRIGLAGSVGNNMQDSDFWMKDASYLRLKNAELGYSFNLPPQNRLGISDLRVFINGYNLLTFDKLDIIDPEASGYDMDYLLMKIFNMGVSVKF
ncbi:TonB-dependent receptor [Mariniphaga sediminis]|nr:TonB-dependent receptor [Mariniphaga sediminis]